MNFIPYLLVQRDKMWKIVLSVVVVFFAVDVRPQFQLGDFLTRVQPITDFLNNITINDVARVLKWLPIPHPLHFDGRPVRQNDVLFHLYTRRNPEFPEILKSTSNKFRNLDTNNEVKFIIHGWIEDARRPYVLQLVEAYLQRGDYNVIPVNWAVPAANEYTISARNTKTSGRAVGDFIIRLSKLANVTLNQVHILGHSLGAHLAGFAGKRVLQRTGQRVGRITALDMAGPLFEIPVPVGRNTRLDRSDAQFVDCIHTDGGIFGMVAPVCHADFYPNGGTPRQPGCSMLNIQQLSSRVIVDDQLAKQIPKTDPNSTINILHVFRNVFCSHYRSHELYRESINSNGFLSTNCDNFNNYRTGKCNGRPTVQMGEDTPVQTRGKFYLETNAFSPYARS